MPRDVNDLVNVSVSAISSSISSAVKAYPNPTAGIINVEFSNAATRQIAVYDLIGNMVKNTIVRGNSLTLDISNYPKGQYLIRVISNEEIDVIKILKQ
jgi:hypothetical protein